MAMTARRDWTLSEIAVELRLDRRTVARHISAGDVEPIGNGPAGPLYRLGDVARALAARDALGERDLDFTHWSARCSGTIELAASVLERLEASDRHALDVLAMELFDLMAADETEGFKKRPPDPAAVARLPEKRLRAWLREAIQIGGCCSSLPIGELLADDECPARRSRR